MADILIRGLSETAVRELDAQAATQGLSRNEFLRRRLEADVAPRMDVVFSPIDLQRAGTAVADLLDEDLMESAWR